MAATVQENVVRFDVAAVGVSRACQVSSASIWITDG
jgi:hypothetical protein